MISLQVASVIGAARRRGWPLRPQFRKSDLTLKAIRRHREQLWAEAVRGSPDNEGAFGPTLPVGRFCPRSAPEQGCISGLLQLSLNGVPAGEHAFHIHAVGKCEPPGFDSAGGHFNPANTHHGMMSGPGASITLDKDKPNSVFHPGGTAIVIHAGKDDYTSDPAGNAGGRIICGVIGE
jgi:Cu-Zn family superoxide dismutase